MTPQGNPETLIEAIAFFSNPQAAHDYMVGKRWPGGVHCPYCDGTTVSFYSNRRVFRCAPCKKQFSVKVGTIFEDSPLGLDKWLPCVWLIVNAKNGVSSCELGRALGVQQKTAWFMLHRVRAAFTVAGHNKMAGTVEADESYIGGEGKNMHKEAKKRKLNGRGTTGKAVVFGLLQRGEKGASKVRAKVIQKTNRPTIHGEVHANVEVGANLNTDSFLSYKGLNADYIHQAVDHAVEYVKGQVHTNGLENFWCLLKRTLKGTYVHVNATQLQAYLDEQVWRYNERKMDDGERFAAIAKAVCGKRLTYKQLTSRALAA